MKKKVHKLAILCIIGLFLCACSEAEELQTPEITSKPKVLVVDAATPTPTLTPEDGDLPETEVAVPTEAPSSVPEESVTPVPTATPMPTQTPTPTKAPTKAPKPTQAPTTTPEPTKAEKRPYEKGELTGNEFRSKWMGMKFTAGAGMELSSQEELDETMRLTEEAVYGREIKGALDYETLALVYEMSLVWQDKGLIMQVMVERMADASATEADYVAAMWDEMSELEENGFTYTVDDKTYSETIAGKQFSNFGYTTYMGEDVSVHQENYIRKQDDRIIIISIMGESEAGMQELLKQFKAY